MRTRCRAAQRLNPVAYPDNYMCMARRVPAHGVHRGDGKVRPCHVSRNAAMIAPLCAAELLVFEGPDAIAFAHAQFSNDVKSLAVDTWQWNAWLDPQGRVRCFFALMRIGPTRLTAWLPLGGAEPMREALMRFVMRAALKLETLAWTLHAMDAAAVPTAMATAQVIAHKGGYALLQPATPSRIAWIAPDRAASIDTDALNRWRLDDIDAGLPLLSATLSGEFLAQALDLERFDAIRFDKGCYPGQEIAARLHFRGGNKRHLQRVRVYGEAPSTGSAILDEGRATVGRILYCASANIEASDALAVLAPTQADAPMFSAHGERIELC